MEVAIILTELQLDSETIAAGLIHDIIEDTEVTKEEIERVFGEEIALLVDGVTKISGYSFASREERQAENFRKMILSMAKDIRVIIIKLADRLHNIRTLEFHEDRHKIETIARETLEIYAPIAHRLGMGRIKWELEDLAMKFLYPEAYDRIMLKIDQKRNEREQFIALLKKPLMNHLDKEGIEADISGRPKHFYSIFKKMSKQEKALEEIHDLIGLRIETGSVSDCYHILGMVHSLWQPIHEKFKDYIATPKSNMYQSLHTSVIVPGGEMVEVQIRTHAMHERAENGIAAHWLYKEERPGVEKSDEQFMWLRRILEWQKDLTDPHEFMEYLKIDLFQDEIFIFTPRGDLIRLPAGSTSVDFAFAIHTEVGYHCVGSKVNGKIVPLHHVLKSGDTVQIIQSQSQYPSADWLNFVKTSKAKSKIRHVVYQKELEQSTALGKQILEREARRLRYRLKWNKSTLHAVKKIGFDTYQKLFLSIGRGEYSPSQFFNSLDPELKKNRSRSSSRMKRMIDTRKNESYGVRIQGHTNFAIRFAQCCQPVPGDNIFGYITRGRGISVHRADCPNTFHLLQEEDRKINVQWDVKDDRHFPVEITIIAGDRPHLLYDITDILSNSNINILRTKMKTDGDFVQGDLRIEVFNLAQLNRIIHDLKKVESIKDVYRREFKRY
jgi:GTP pyrophosphokinase